MSMENPTVKEVMAIPWKSESGIVENIENLAKEYLKTRNLQVLFDFCLILTSLNNYKMVQNSFDLKSSAVHHDGSGGLGVR